MNLNTFHNDDDFKNFGVVENQSSFLNTSGGKFTNTGAKLLNKTGGTFDIQASSEFVNDHGDVLNETGAIITRNDLSTFANSGTFFGTGMFDGDMISDSDAIFYPNTESTVGSYTITGNYTQNGTATYKVEILDAVQYDVIDITENAILDGTINIELSGGYLPTFNGQEFVLLTYGDFTGNFSTVNFPDITGTGLAWSLVYDATELKLVASSVLPVELVTFEANLFRNDVQLDWTTATEINNDFFAVEHSINGRDFSATARIQSLRRMITERAPWPSAMMIVDTPNAKNSITNAENIRF